jgi:methionyl-tRNA formyltransferase
MPSKKKVILIGSIPLATKVLCFLHSHELVRVLGVICERQSRRFKASPFPEPCVYDVVEDLDVALTTIEQVESQYGEGELDLAFSCRAPYILKPAFLSRFSKGVVNFHGGPLPELAGVHAANHAIICGFDRSGATLHYMNRTIDTGPIIAKEYFPIGPHDIALDVYRNTQKTLWALFIENIDAILEDREEVVSQQLLSKRDQPSNYFSPDALKALKVVDITMPGEEIYRRVRGCDFPEHEPAYLVIEGRKVYLTTQKFFNCNNCDSIEDYE